VCYRYTNLAYIITDENTLVKEPAFVGLLFPNFSTTFWVVPIQCGLVKLTTHKVTNYSLFTPLLLFCRTDWHLAMLEVFRKNHRPLAEVSWQGTAPYYVRTFRL
jgi:hypothetical protein